jgi:hypothetical protein
MCYLVLEELMKILHDVVPSCADNDRIWWKFNNGGDF